MYSPMWFRMTETGQTWSKFRVSGRPGAPPTPLGSEGTRPEAPAFYIVFNFIMCFCRFFMWSWYIFASAKKLLVFSIFKLFCIEIWSIDLLLLADPWCEMVGAHLATILNGFEPNSTALNKVISCGQCVSIHTLTFAFLVRLLPLAGFFFP